jgi:hypothetical protein
VFLKNYPIDMGNEMVNAYMTFATLKGTLSRDAFL